MSMNAPETMGVIYRLQLSQLHPHPQNPFSIRDDQAMLDLIQSVQSHGVLVPAIARPRPDGEYEIIAGHRRKHASELAGLDFPRIKTYLRHDGDLQRCGCENAVQHLQSVTVFVYMVPNEHDDPALTIFRSDEIDGRINKPHHPRVCVVCCSDKPLRIMWREENRSENRLKRLAPGEYDCISSVRACGRTEWNQPGAAGVFQLFPLH